MQLIVLLWSLFLVRPIVCGHCRRDDWAQDEDMDRKGEYHIYWKSEGTSVVICLKVATMGWVGFGLAGDSLLSGSDVVIGWVKDGVGYLYDYHGDNRGVLALDRSQDWKLLYSSENATHTTLGFTRSMATCDSEDKPITNGIQPFVFAYSKSDMKHPNMTKDLYPQLRAMWSTHYLMLLQARFHKVPMTEDISVWDVRANNLRVPGNVTDYFYCKFIRGLPLNAVHHIVKVSPIITPGHEDNVINILVNPCVPRDREESEAAIRYGGGDCNSPHMPNLMYRCWNLLSVHLIRAKGVVYPQFAGAPIGGHHAQYYMFYIYYYNPKLRKDIIDNSGLRHYYTPNLRPYDSAITWGPGQIISPLIVIPPNQRRFTLTPVTPAECLSKGMPTGGVKLFALLSDLQLIGSHLKLRHFRGKRELPPITDIPNYSSFHRGLLHLEKSVTILPGDRLMIECTFDSTSRNRTTLGGFPLVNEYCDVLLFHYPPMPYLRILSSPTLELVAGLTGMNLTTRKYTVDVLPEGYAAEASESYVQYLENYKWSNCRTCSVQNAMQYSPQFATCADRQQRVIEIRHVTRPDNFIPYRKPDSCKGNGPDAGARKSKCEEC